MDSKLLSEIICCPNCKSDVIISDNIVQCNNCGEDYKIINGIIDFRHSWADSNSYFRDEGFVEKVDKSHRIEEILQIFDNVSYKELLEKYFSFFSCTKDRLDKSLKFRIEAIERTQNLLFRISQIISFNQSDTGINNKKIFLDVGCGVCGLPILVSDKFSVVIGSDYDFEQLLLGKKLCETQNIDNIFLICADAENLPFVDDCIDVITALDIIEHVGEQQQILTEFKRVINQNGCIYFTSPNRFFFIERHVHLFGIGFLPRFLMNKYVSFRTGFQFSVKTLSYFELRRIVSEVFGENYRILHTHPKKISVVRRIVDILFKIPLFNYLLNLIFPSYEVYCFKCVKNYTSTDF